jgi:CRP-like cAMP-binding protein
MVTIEEILERFELNEAETEAIMGLTQTVSLKRGAHFLQAGSMCTEIALLLEGSLYAYSLTDEAEEVVKDLFFSPNRFVIFDYESYLNGLPSSWNIKSFEDSVLLTFRVDAAIGLYKIMPRLYQLEIMLMKQHFVKSLQRIDLLQSQNAIQRISLLRQQYPDIFAKIPFQYIASYLGMHRNTFNKAFKKL